MSINPGNFETQEFTLNMGPQHPSTHGVYRAVLTMDGEYINNIENRIGYLHRGMEKIAETRTYTQFIPYTSRLDYVSGMLNNLAYVQTIEKLMTLEIPERAEYIRVMMAELQRIASHLVYLASLSIDLNAVTGWMYGFTLREKILDLFEMVCGTRMTTNYMRIGGVSNDLPEGFIQKLEKVLDEIPGRLDEFEGLTAGNEILVARLKGIAAVDPDTAVNYGISGPDLRAAGVRLDMRKTVPCGYYDRFEFDIPVMENGDCYDRFIIRILEIRRSLRIIIQVLEALPQGMVSAKVPKVIKPPKGEAFHQIEGSKGILGFHVVSDGSTKPYRLHIHSPSFMNIGILPRLGKGITIQDFVSLIASVDFIVGEVDR